MTNLADIMSSFAADADELLIEAPGAWSQGRTQYGGMTAALCYEAAIRLSGQAAPLRSAQLTFAGPASGRLRLRPEILRAGKSATIVVVDCTAEKGPAARAAFAFGSDRESRIAQAAPARPPTPAPEDCPVFMEGGGGFHEQFETRLAQGSHLFSGSAATFSVWVRFRDRQDVDATTALLALADSLPPAAMTLFPEPAPISTMTWSIDFAKQPASADGWHLLRSTSEHSGNGYALQAMSLWDAGGDLVASGRQAVAIFA